MKTDHIKRRNVWVQLALFVVTLSLYQIYWFYVTLRDLHIANDHGTDSGLWVLLLFIPIASWFAGWHYSGELAHFTNDRYPKMLMFVLWIFLRPAVLFLAQQELNQASTAPV